MRAPFPTHRRSLRAVLAIVVILAVLPAGAHAVTGPPQLVETYPEYGAHVQTQFAHQMTALYDRPLDIYHSDMRLEDKDGNDVAGTLSFRRIESDPNHFRIIVFTPEAALTEAASPYTATACACAATCETNSWPFTIDNTAPAAPVVTAPVSGDIRREQKVDVRGSAEPGARIVIIENETQIAAGPATQSGDFSVQLPYGDEDGVQHTIAARAVDEAGNVSEPTGPVSFIHDDVTVLPFITKPLQGAFIGTTTVEIAGTAKASSTIYLYANSAFIGTAPTDANGRWSGTFGLAEGSYAVIAYSWDGATQDGPSNTRNFTVDVTAPGAPVILVPAAGARIGSSNVIVSGTTEAFATITVRESTQGVVGTATATAGGQWSTTVPLADGPHTITATATDRAGNESTSSPSVTFTVDTIAPTKPVFITPHAGDIFGSVSVGFTGSAEPNSVVQILESGTVRGSTTTSASGTFSVTISFDEGLHTVRAVAIDAAGNGSAPSDVLSFTIDTVPPAVPVIYSPPESGQYTHTEVYVAGVAEANVRIELYEGATLLQRTASDKRGNWNILRTFLNGTHVIKARAIDLAGNIGPFTDDRTFLVGAVYDTSPPPIPFLEDPEQDSLQPAFVIFTGQSEPGSTVRIYEGPSSFISGTAEDGTFELGVRLDDGIHSVRATATDPDGNVSVFSPIRSFRVDAKLPTVKIDTATGLANLAIFVRIQSFELSGSASDDRGVRKVILDFKNLITGVSTGPIDADTCVGCPNAPVTWTASPTNLASGVYQVDAFAIDIAGNKSNVATIRMILV